MKILQITDLHFGKHNGAIQASLLTQVEALGPDVILATGDLADSPSDSLFIQAKKYLEELQSRATGEDGRPPHLIAIPGNHDATVKGILKFRSCGKFWDHFPDLEDYFDPAGKVWIFPFDSATKVKTSDLSRGVIGDDELERFHTRYAELRRNHGTSFDDAYKIVILHHHPLPVNFETDWKQPWLTINNSGALLGAALQKKIDLILHGHEHLQARAILHSTLGGEEIAHGAHVLSLGATLRKVANPKRNWFYMIDVGTNGTVRADAYRTQGTAFDDEPFESIELRSSRDVRERSFHSNRERGLRVGSISASVEITPDGDADRVVEFQNARARGEAIGEHPFELPRTSGYVDTDSLHAESASQEFSGLHSRSVSGGPQKVSAVVDFDGNELQAADQKLDFTCRWWALNAFAMNRVQFQLKYPGDAAYREYCEYTVAETESVEELVIAVKFPPELAPDAVHLRVTDPATGDRDGGFERELRKEGALQYVDQFTTAFLRVPYPRSGCSYAIEWKISEGSDFAASLPAEVADLWHELFSEDRKSIVTKTLIELLEALIEAARTSEGICKTGGKRWDFPLHANLMLFDPEGSKLRLLELVPADGSGIGDRDPREIAFDYGVGICGRVFKTNDKRLYVGDRATPEDGPNFYLSGKVDDDAIAVLLSVPLRWNEDDAFPYGVLNLSSPLKACPLRKAVTEAEAVGEYERQVWDGVSKTLRKLGEVVNA